MKKFFSLLLLLIVIIFIAQNYKVTEIRFLAWSFMVSRALMILLALLIGIIIGWLFSPGKR